MTSSKDGDVMMTARQALMARLGYVFDDATLLARALSHRSLNMMARHEGDNQRLEFLGDRVLGMILAEMLYRAFPGEPEGALARRQAYLASRPAITRIAREIELGESIELSSAEHAGGGRNLDSTLEDACEALIGALYIDGGLEAARSFVEPHWRVMLESELSAKDAKTELQEWAQGRGLPIPRYEIAKRSGPDHAPMFTIRVSVAEHSANGQGAPKKRAEQEAASKLLEQIGSRT